jgi:hypothetical protein
MHGVAYGDADAKEENGDAGDERLHACIQDEARHRFPVEGVSAGVFAASALMLLRAGAKRRVSGR